MVTLFCVSDRHYKAGSVKITHSTEEDFREQTITASAINARGYVCLLLEEKRYNMTDRDWKLLEFLSDFQHEIHRFNSHGEE